MVKGVDRKVVWSRVAASSFRRAIGTIKQDSPKNAEKVRSAILKMTQDLPLNPHRYPPDRFKFNNTGRFRAFEKYSYRVTYKLSDHEIRIIRFRHVRQEPIEY